MNDHMVSDLSGPIPHLLALRTAASPEKPFLFAASDGRSWTYDEFLAGVGRLAGRLYAMGVRKGDVVSLLMANSPEYIFAYFACWRIGAIAGPINSMLKPAEIAWAVANSESRLVLFSSGLQGGLAETADAETLEIGEAIAAAENSDPPPETEIDTDDEAIIIYTSGTTGKPKGCLLTHANLIANAGQITRWMRFGPDDRLLTVMPLFHMNAVTVTTMTALYCGGSTIIAPKFSASRFWDTVARFNVTSFGSVATMLSMLIARSDDGALKPLTPSLRFAMCGSAPVPAEVLRRFEEKFGVLVIEGYGLSESTCRATFNPPDASRRPGSCGLPIGNEMMIVDENDRELPPGVSGEIVLRGPNIFKGYFRNPEATAAAFRNGWFHTGDIGYRDEDGFYYIIDRKSDMIIRGGENIYPREIDELLYRHPAIEAAAVIGVPDKLYGEEVAAFVVLKKNMTATEADLIAFCRQHLADYKCPKTIRFVNELPKGPTGKLLKRELAALWQHSAVNEGR